MTKPGNSVQRRSNRSSIHFGKTILWLLAWLAVLGVLFGVYQLGVQRAFLWPDQDYRLVRELLEAMMIVLLAMFFYRLLTGTATETSDAHGHLGIQLLRGLQVTLVLTVGVILFLHHSPVGRHLEQAGYEMLRQAAAGSDLGPDPPVYVVDTSNVGLVRPSGTKEQPDRADPSGSPVDINQLHTNRKPLRQFLEQVAEHEETRPRTIGIDLNFHSDTGFIDSKDSFFFDVCRRLELKDVPLSGAPIGRRLKIYLGVREVDPRDPRSWLGMPDYQSLAAFMGVLGEGVSQVPAELPIFASPLAPSQSSGREQAPLILPSLAYALAQAYRDEPAWPPPPLPGSILLEERQLFPLHRRNGSFHTRTFLVDYRWLRTLREQTRPLEEYLGRPDLQRRLQNKIVLLGDVEHAWARDAFVVPGEDEPIAGVLVHACAAATLAEGPLYAIRPEVRALLDIGLAFVILSLVTLVRWRLRRSGWDLHEGVLPATFLLTGCLAVAVSYGLMHVPIVWPDALIVALALAVHSPIEQAWTFLSQMKTPAVRDRHVPSSSHTSPAADGGGS